jgi:hypothetical protein
MEKPLSREATVAHPHEGHVPPLKQGFSTLSEEMQKVCIK